MTKSISDILKRFDNIFNVMDKSGIIYGKNNSIRLDKNLNQLGAIKDFIAIEIKELLEGIVKKERNRIEIALEKYMKGTYLEQDSIFLHLHDIIYKDKIEETKK